MTNHIVNGNSQSVKDLSPYALGDMIECQDGDFAVSTLGLLKFKGYDNDGQATYLLPNGEVVDGYEARTLRLFD
jgi:hypothetical protein